jgi:hypothetical protein
MKSGVPAVLAALLLPLCSFAQSTLNFPRVMQPQEFSTTGFALINPGADNALVTYTLYGENGTELGTTTQTIPARGQLAKLANELFPGATGAGWIQATTPVSGVEGFWFGGDLATFADGAEAAPSSNELVLPLINPFAEINVTNTGNADVTVLLRPLGTEGFEAALPYPRTLRARGFFRMSLAGMFPELPDFAVPTHMRITCGCSNGSLAATVIARNYIAGPSWAVTNGVPAESSGTALYFPHLVQGSQGAANWESHIGITNLSTTSPNDVDITFVPQSGTPQTNRQTIAPNGQLRLSARQLFVMGTGFQSGWIRVTSASGLPITGYIGYADLVAGSVAVVPPQQDAENNLLFAHIADLPPWLTGIALLNANLDTAAIEVFALTPAGSLIGSTTISLAPGANTARLLRDLVPLTQTRFSDGGFVFVRSSLPIYGIELFFSRNQQVLANVPASSGITFVPPPR